MDLSRLSGLPMGQAPIISTSTGEQATTCPFKHLCVRKLHQQIDNQIKIQLISTGKSLFPLFQLVLADVRVPSIRYIMVRQCAPP